MSERIKFREDLPIHFARIEKGVVVEQGVIEPEISGKVVELDIKDMLNSDGEISVELDYQKNVKKIIITDSKIKIIGE